MQPAAATIDFSLVIPCYNEEAVLPKLKDRLLECLPKLGVTWEVILVDDGSVDRTAHLLEMMNREDARFKVVVFSRNFGHQAAVSAGLANATGEAVGIIDADLQDPPEIFFDAFQKLQAGYDVVFAIRRKRKENIFKRSAYAAFYRILKLIAEIDIPLDSGDFCLMKRPVVNVLCQLPERNVFLRGLRAWSGFRQTGIEYAREARQAGETKYSFKKLLKLAGDGIFSFSTFPLRLSLYFGFLALFVSILLGSFILAWRLANFEFMGHKASELPGWAAIAIGLLFLSGMQFLLLGCLGEYVGRIYTEVKHRPRWIVQKTFGLFSPANQPLRINQP
ncbi:MAG: glycosyltransferase family 2 protein [Verrucomicrobiota bacterium]